MTLTEEFIKNADELLANYLEFSNNVNGKGEKFLDSLCPPINKQFIKTIAEKAKFQASTFAYGYCFSKFLQTKEAKFEPTTMEKAREEVFNWQRYQHAASNFSSQIINLFGKADSDNLLRLKTAFPELYSAYSEWSREGDKVFERWFNINQNQ